MINRLVISTAISAISTVAYVCKTNRQLRKEKEYYRQKSIMLAKMLSTTGETLVYTMSILEKNGIEFDKFDSIVFDTEMRKILEELTN